MGDVPRAPSAGLRLASCSVRSFSVYSSRHSLQEAGGQRSERLSHLPGITEVTSSKARGGQNSECGHLVDESGGARAKGAIPWLRVAIELGVRGVGGQSQPEWVRVKISMGNLSVRSLARLISVPLFLICKMEVTKRALPCCGFIHTEGLEQLLGLLCIQCERSPFPEASAPLFWRNTPTPERRSEE